MPKVSDITQFLNVDLDLRSEHGLDELVEALGDRVIVLNREGANSSPQFAALELNGAERLSLDETIRRILATIQSLSPAMRAIWDGCLSRQLNIGIQGGVEPHCRTFEVSEQTAVLLADMRCAINVSVYARRST